MSATRKTAGQRARALAKRQGKRQISAILPLISQAVEQASAEGLFRTDVVLEGRWFLDETNQRDLRKALRVEHLDSANPRINSSGQFELSIFWGDYPLENAPALHGSVALRRRALILVTNASGSVGRATLRALDAHRDLFLVRATSRQPSRQLSAQFPRVEWVAADLQNAQSTADACTGVTKIFHIPPSASSLIRKQQAQCVADAAAQQGVQHIVDLSMIAADHRVVEVQRGMHDSEQAVESGTVPWTHLRAAFFLENVVPQQADAIKNTNQFYLPLADAGVSMVAVRDVAQVAATLITRAGAEGFTVNLTGPEVITGQQCADILSEETGRTIGYISPSEEQFRASMGAKQAPQELIDNIWELLELLQDGAQAKASSDGKRLLGASATTFRQMVRQNLAAL